MNIPTQLHAAIATLPPEESEELTELIHAFLGDSELETLIDENLNRLVCALQPCSIPPSENGDSNASPG